MVSSLTFVSALLSFSALGQALSLANTKHIFSFGDSYTADNFSVAVSLNASGPGQFLATSTGGYNWLQFLANATGAKDYYYDLAVQGASVDNAIVDQGIIPAFKDQVTTFTTHFGPNSTVQWDPDTTLFTLFFLINDVGFSYSMPGLFQEKLPYIMASYDSSVARLYAAGARHFLILGVPPTDRTPTVRMYESGAYVSTFKANVALANAEMINYLDNSFPSKYPLATEKRYDTGKLFNAIADQPTRYAIKTVDYSCPYYEEVYNEPLINDERCIYPLSAYMWWNGYHPSWTVHRYMANDIRRFLSSTGMKRARHFGTPPHA